MIGYKLLRKRKDESYGPLFINQKQRLYLGETYPAEDHPTKGFAYRPGWHILPEPKSNRLVEKDNRVWCMVEFDLREIVHKPVTQGGMCYLGSTLTIIEELDDECMGDYGLTCEECGKCEEQ